MGDDGLGVATVEALRGTRAAERADLIDAGLAFSEVLCDLDPDRPLIILDAVRGGGHPGSIYHLQLSDLDLTTGSLRECVSLHELSVLPALQMEALGGRQFKDVTIYGVEPGDIGWSQELSEPVAAAVTQLTELLCNCLDQRASQGIPPLPEATCGSVNP